MKYLLLPLLTVGLGVSIGVHYYNNNISPKVAINKPVAKPPIILLKKTVANLKKYAAAHGYNTQYVFVINMAAPSGSKRFYIINCTNDSIENSGLVAHGSGSETKGGTLTFNNTINSHASSIGKYKIGNSYQGTFGLAYKLYGLDATNSKALERFVVLHSHSCVPNYEVHPQPICVSWGCPTVNPIFLQVLQGYISKATKPILLDIEYLK